MATTLKLTKPIRSRRLKTVSELTLTEPTLGMLDGVNLRITAEGELNIDLGAIRRSCSAAWRTFTPSAAKDITIKDALAAQEVVADFFGRLSSKLARPRCRTSVVLPLAAE